MAQHTQIRLEIEAPGAYVNVDISGSRDDCFQQASTLIDIFNSVERPVVIRPSAQGQTTAEHRQLMIDLANLLPASEPA